MSDDARLDRIEESIQRLLERIEHLESKRGLGSDVHDNPEPTHPAVSPAGSAADEATPTVPSAASVLENDGDVDAATPSIDAQVTNVDSEGDATAAIAPPPIVPPSPESRIGGPPARSASTTEGVNIEQLIGTRLVAVVGGLLVALAAAFFAKLAYDSGWIGAIPPIVRALGLALAGGALLVVADVLRRRLGKPAAIGLALAGLGTLYVDGWALDSVLGLVPPEGAVLALAVTTLVGLVITARFGSMLLGGVSLVAGGLAPYVVGGEPSVLAPGLYFTALLAAAMGASIVRPHPFGRLRAVGLTIVAIFALPWWLGAVDAGEISILLLVSIAWWGVVHAASLVAAGRGHDWRMGAGMNLFTTAAIAIPVPISLSALGGGPDLSAPEGWTVLAFAAVSIAMAFQFGPGLAALSSPASTVQRRERCQHRLAETAWLEAGVLVIVAAALLLRGASLPVAWIGIALAVVVYASRQGNRRAAVFGGIAAVLSQYAASYMVIAALPPGGANWLAGTPFSLSAVPELWIVPVTFAGIVTTAIWWPARGEERGVSVGPTMILASGVPAWLIPAVALGAPGWWTLVVLAPFGAATLVTRRRVDLAGWRFGIVWAVIALVPLVVAMAIPVVGTFDGPRGMSEVAGELRGTTLGWGGSRITLAAVAGVHLGFLASIVSMGRLARFGPEAIDARARATMRLLPVAAVPLAAGLLMFAVPATRIGWSSWVGPPMVGAVGASAILLLLLVLRRSRFLHVSTTWITVLTTLSAAVWMAAAIATGFSGDLVPAEQPPILNVRGLTGVGLVLVTAGTLRAGVSIERSATPLLAGMLVMLALVLGTLLVQDLAGRSTLAADTGISIWWAGYAIGLIVVGFRVDLPVLRKTGLLLLAVTAIKFLLMDLRNAETIHRIVSALGVGLLMVLTSVIYVRAGRGESDGSIGENGSDPT